MSGYGDTIASTNPFQNVNYSCPIYCLSLLENAWKTEAARSYFENIGIEVSFLPGFHGSTLGLTPELAVDTHSDGKRSFIAPTQLATVLSHLSVLRTALHCGSDHFLVFEDDVVLEHDFESRWPTVQDDLLSHEIDVAQLEYCNPATMLTPITQNIAKCYYAFNASAIWWTRAAALLAIQSVRPICEPWDTALIRRVFPFISHAVVTPPLCRQRTSSGEWPSSVGLEHKPIG